MTLCLRLEGIPSHHRQGPRGAFRTTCKAAGIRYGRNKPNGLIMHDFRRAVKTNMATRKIQKEYRDTIMGHSLKEMDTHYVVPSEAALARAMDQYTKWLDGQPNVDLIVDKAKN